MSDESLDLRGLIVGFAVLVNGSSDDQLLGLGVSGGTVEFTELVGSLGTESLFSNDISESWDWGLTGDHDAELKHLNVTSDDGTSNRLLLFETISPGFETFMTTFHQHSNSFVLKYTLDHCESLMILASSDLKYISIVLLAQQSTINLFAHRFIVEDCPIEKVRIRGQ